MFQFHPSQQRIKSENGKNFRKANLFKELDKIYYHPDEEGSYGGIQKLLKAAYAKGLKVSEKSFKDYLARQASYSLYKSWRKNFKRNQTVVGRLGEQWQADLADIHAISRKHQGTKYVTVIDVFSKYAWAVPSKKEGWARNEKCH